VLLSKNRDTFYANRRKTLANAPPLRPMPPKSPQISQTHRNHAPKKLAHAQCKKIRQLFNVSYKSPHNISLRSHSKRGSFAFSTKKQYKIAPPILPKDFAHTFFSNRTIEGRCIKTILPGLARERWGEQSQDGTHT
jgi:hypothetical protein